ncbi:spermine oxidase-like isoform X2 [Copidosoma floridanum]|uniref:spermine oxidase-like isoform X2 n=1 Tax=Copidosoma floridanum TaxID=29053 RepID=UPI000C6F4E8B|nr:spermine oxidase-like isoform X2 [Copidosoma floridanum]
MEGVGRNSSNAFTEITGVVIVGAGIAGLGAARTLEQSNFKDYVLLEAQSQVGGRICSVSWNGGDGWLEKGAQFLHGTESPLGKLILEKGLLSDEDGSEGQGLFYNEDGIALKGKVVTEVSDHIKNILEDCEVYSEFHVSQNRAKDNIGQVLRRKFKELLLPRNTPEPLKSTREELFDWNVKFIVIDNACTSLNELSVERWGDYKAVNGPEYGIFNTHYGSVVESIAGELTQENIRLECPVKRVEWDNKVTSENEKAVKITLKSGKTIMADCAIVTCSLGYLKENHYKLFSPPLPQCYTTAITSMGFGVINKVFLDFEEPWWEPKTKGFQFLWSGDKEEDSLRNYTVKNKLPSWLRDLTGFDVVPTHRAVLLGWIGGKGAEIVETLNEEEIIKDCAQLLRYFVKDASIPEASRCLRTCWGSNEYVRGAYCHITKKCDDCGASPSVLAEPICRKIQCNDGIERLPILLLAGEATHPHHYSTTHGAYDTGVKQAQIFLRDHHLMY